MAINMEEKEIKKTKEIKEEVEEEVEEKTTWVTGVFYNFENPEGQIKFPYCMKKTDTMELWPRDAESFCNGKTYTIPIEIADHLNNDCAIMIYEHGKDEKGKPCMKEKGLEHRFGFHINR